MNGLNLRLTKREELQRLRTEIDELSKQYIRNMNDDTPFLTLSETALKGLLPEIQLRHKLARLLGYAILLDMSRMLECPAHPLSFGGIGAVCLDGWGSGKGTKLRGMKDATPHVFLTGDSAGGLSVIIHCHRFPKRFPNANTVKCLSDGGFFLHCKDPAQAQEMESKFRGVVDLHNSTGLLPEACKNRMKDLAYLATQL
nr:pectin acetylesterase 8-like [Ipomoea batatas]